VVMEEGALIAYAVAPLAVH